MVKRFSGGIIPQVGLPSAGRAFWNLSDQYVNSIKGLWPANIAKTGNTWILTSIGAVSGLTELRTSMSSLVYSNLSSSGFLKYKIKTGTSTSKDITVAYEKSNSNTSFTQSAFSLLSNTFQYTTSASSILLYSNDDHDSLAMDADGRGIVARSQQTAVNSGSWDKFQGTTEVTLNSALSSVATYNPDFISGTQIGTLISFPLVTGGVWINLSLATYKVNNFSSAILPPAVNIGSAGPGNSLYTISDGVNQFIIGRFGSTSAWRLEVNFETGTLTVLDSITYAAAPAMANATEEDAFGTQLFTVDNRVTFLNGVNYYYGGTNNWTSTVDWSSITGKSSATAGTSSTQTGMDGMSSVGTDRYVWIADWGHDDGGLFGIGNDDRLNTRKSNIIMIPEDYV